MRPRTLVLLAAAASAVLALHHLRSRPGPSAASPSIGAAPRDPSRSGLVPRIHYQLAYEQAAAITGRAPMQVTVRGEWITTPHRSGRTEVRFVPATLDGPRGSVPATADLIAPVQLVRDGGVLVAMGFTAAMPEPGRAMMTALATTFQRSERAGSAWTVTEDDLMGRYDAGYRRDGDVVHRSRDGYRAMRGPHGLSVDAAGRTTARERSRFEVDAAGLVRADLAIELRVALGDAGPAADLTLRASLERTAIEWVPASASRLLPAGPITDHADHRRAIEDADRALVAGASAAELVAELARLAALDRALPGVGHDRAIVLARLAAAIRLDPAAAAVVADAIRAHAADATGVELLAGALASAGVPEATDVLAGLVGAELPAPSRAALIGALSFAAPVTAASLAALVGALDDAGGEQAALALGSHRRRAADALAEPARAAASELLGRYAGARGTERVIYAKALGNAGDPAALPSLREAMRGGDRALRDAAVFSLRFVPGAAADALLEEALADPTLAGAAVRAIGYRGPQVWRERLEAARQRYADRNDVLSAIHAALRRWG